jgi:hypothetical protein
MINILKRTAIGVGMAGTLALAAATPSLARVVAHHPVYHHSGYANAPAVDDIDVYSPCYPSLRWQSRC